MKKIISFLLVLSMLLMLSSCLGDIDTPEDNPSTITITNTPQTNVDQFTDMAEKPDAAYLNGTKLSEYTIVYGKNDVDYSKRAAEYIQEQISERTGISLEVKTDADIEPMSNEIVVGETTRKISEKLDEDTEHTEFALLAYEGSVALEGDFFVIAAAAYFFVETYITGETFKSNVPTESTIFEPIVKEAKNYIILIGDGMGLYQTQLFNIMDASVTLGSSNNYSDGEDVFYGYMLPYLGFARTNSLSGTTDSAAGGTALSTGYKTINSYVGKDKNLNDIPSLTVLAASLGKSAAVMSTESATGATPASFFAHTSSRSDSADIIADKGEAEQKYGTIIECGYDTYDNLGVGQIQSTVNKTLDKLSENENGFFMMYEEGHIDYHCHKNDINMTFKALIRFNQVIGVVMEYAFYNPETVVLITADHETGSLLPNENGGFSYNCAVHSSHFIPVFAYGYGAEVFDNVTIENTQIPKTYASLWGVSDFGDQTDEYKPLG